MGRTRAPRFGEKIDEALAAQHLQRFAHRIGRGAKSLGEIGDNQPFIGRKPAGDDVVADTFVEGHGALAGDVDIVESRRRRNFKFLVRQSGAPQLSMHSRIMHGFVKQCTIGMR